VTACLAVTGTTLQSTMTVLFYVAAFLAIALGIVHSALGERYILIRLFRRTELPKLFGSTEFTSRVLRFAWHLTTIAWWGFAAILVMLATRSVSERNLSLVLAVTFLITGTIILAISRAKHLAWPVFLLIGGICLYAAVG
jgi:hypothetical protein